MQPSRKHFVGGLLAGALAVLLLLLLAGITVAYTGAYDMAASSGHTSGMRWWLDTTMRNSVSHRADARPLTRADAAAGAAEYEEMCEHCHGGPGVEPAAWSRGMLPQPPLLTEAARTWQPGEIVWIVRHGLKYTGMPAFGEDHDDQTLRNIAAFVKSLPAMTPADYHHHTGAAGHQH